MKYTKDYILECLDRYCYFDGELSSNNFEDQVVRPLRNAKCFDIDDWSWDNGVSKGVLIFFDNDFVIKIPFNGSSDWYESHFCTANGSWRSLSCVLDSCGDVKPQYQHIEGEETFQPFEGASYDSNTYGWDYCKAEQELYKKAKTAGVACFFAKTECIGVAGEIEHPIYAQTRCQMFEDAYMEHSAVHDSRTQEDYTLARCTCSQTNSDWILDCILYFGQEITDKLVSFLNEWHVSDLHDGNIGYFNGKPCLIDYSSYDG